MGMNSATNLALDWVEQGHVPDTLVRAGIRRLLRERLVEICAGDAEASGRLTEEFVAQMRAAETAPLPEKANEQHYELPAAFFAAALGPHRKYSCCEWGEGVATLQQAEAAALATTCQRAGLSDGQDVLELGCGWGSLSLWMAARYPNSRITVVSNSHSQRAHIEAEAARRGYANLRVITCDMNVFDTEAAHYDRIVSVEMFEHMRNWPALFARVAGWLKPGGRFFMHVFVHRDTPYPFIERDAGDWMSRYFFSGGMMPSDELATRFQDQLAIVSRWRWDGRHYERTANAWLANMDAQRGAIWPVFEATYGREAEVWWTRWRLFFMSVAELFGYEKGQQWWVSHYLFERRE